MSSPQLYSHPCICDVKILYVDGDTDTVYCENCEGVVGRLEDFVITPEGIMKGFKNERVTS